MMKKYRNSAKKWRNVGKPSTIIVHIYLHFYYFFIQDTHTSRRHRMTMKNSTHGKVNEHLKVARLSCKQATFRTSCKESERYRTLHSTLAG